MDHQNLASDLRSVTFEIDDYTAESQSLSDLIEAQKLTIANLDDKRAQLAALKDQVERQRETAAAAQASIIDTVSGIIDTDRLYSAITMMREQGPIPGERAGALYDAACSTLREMIDAIEAVDISSDELIEMYNVRKSSWARDCAVFEREIEFFVCT